MSSSKIQLPPRASWSDTEIGAVAQDRFGFKDYARVMAEQAKIADTPLTIGIFGRWGSGKSSLMKLIQSELDQTPDQSRAIQFIRKALGMRRGVETLWINVWQLSNQEELWNAFLQALLTRVHKELPLHQQLIFDGQLLAERVNLGELVRQLLVNSYRILIVFAPLLLTLLWPTWLPSNPIVLLGLMLYPADLTGGSASLILALWLLLKPLVGTIKDKVSLDLGKIINEAPYEARVSTLQRLQSQFEQMVKAWVGENGQLVVFIDDLDRCSPDQVPQVLEALKLFTATRRCVYVLGLDFEVVLPGIVSKYKFAVNEAAEYLEKIFQIPFELPPLQQNRIAGFVRIAYPDLREQCPTAPDVFSIGLEPNPRKVKRALNIYRMLLKLATSRAEAKRIAPVDPELLAKMVVVQSRFRRLYDHLEHDPDFLPRLEDVDAEKLKGTDTLDRLIGSKGQNGLVEPEELSPLFDMLQVGKSRFGQQSPTLADLQTYIYLTSTDKGGAGGLFPVREERDALLSNDPDKIQAKVAEILGRAKTETELKPIAEDYTRRLKQLVALDEYYTQEERRSANLAFAEFEIRSTSTDKVTAYSAALQRDPNDALLHMYLADAYDELGRSEEAEKEYVRAIELEPEKHWVRTQLPSREAVQPSRRGGGRPLRPNELEAARQIFGDGLDYARVRISEGSPTPNLIGRVGALLKGMPAPQANAITLGNTSYFPRALTTDSTDMAWLMHELTHQWQYQHSGMRYLTQSMTGGTFVYTNPGETPSAALARQYSEGKQFRDFNPEQQGDLVRDYFFALEQTKGEDPRSAQEYLSAWEPYLKEIRSA